MTTLTRTGSRRGWPILATAAIGPLAFVYLIYQSILILVRQDSLPHPPDYFFSAAIVVAAVGGLLLELRAFVGLCDGAPATISNFFRVVGIHLGILIGVVFLIVFPTSSLSNFPERYERELHRVSDLPPIFFDSEGNKILFVAMQFLMVWVFIKLGLSILKGVDDMVDRMTAPDLRPSDD